MVRIMRTALALLPLALVVACTDPREACLSNAVEELSTVDALILETEQALERGYRTYPTNTGRASVGYCIGNRSGGTVAIGLSLCNDVRPQIVDKPVAIDRVEEQRKLEDLRQTRARLALRSEAEASACRARFPAAG
ncbi:hypothetical protein RM543_00875 [Roseicyclus sp. F158]|uniref:Uncharacterized protein n=1 Tax=Tropicimonas omnivorans TaxID=3075590 RepID=A0ABU3DBX9_9RHOB|nr:hypothetical protein [Roseicyclus sp. F158]MDT0681220.1 hypothetical protein [Roseicyclus sp. F158]